MLKIEELKAGIPFSKRTLALGADSKPTLAFNLRGKIFIISDDNDSFAPAFYKKALEELRNKFHFRPEVILCDSHPDFISNYLPINKLKKFAVFHHRAHFAGCLFENDIQADAIGVTFDGTGFGEDKNSWGSEFFIKQKNKIKRIAHLEYVALPGNEKAINETWRMAFSYLYQIYGARVKDLKLDWFKKISPVDFKIAQNLLEKSFNAPLTSSMGRLFDAVSAILGLKLKVGYQAQAAIELEKIAAHSETAEYYNFEIKKIRGEYIISQRNLVKEIVADLKSGKSKAYISRKFHNAVIKMVGQMLGILGKESGIKIACFSGGVFHNRILAEGIKKTLTGDFKLVFNSPRFLGDSGIALGQIAYYNWSLN